MIESELEWLDQFLGYLVREKAYSPHTKSAYQRDIEHFNAFCTSQSLATWDALNPQHVRQYAANCHRQGSSGRSIQRRLSSVRSFYHFLMREGRVESNPALSIKAPKSEKRLPKVLDVDQMEQLLRVESTDLISLRDIAIMELFYSSGLRLTELVELNIFDLDLTDNVVRVTGKGNKTRIVPIGRLAKQALQAWLSVRGQWANDLESAIFISKRGGRIKQRSIQERLRIWGVKQGVSGEVHPHRLRHSFASHLLESSGDIRAVQELLGHANISTTQVYTHLDFQHLAKVYDAAHPRAKKK